MLCPTMNSNDYFRQWTPSAVATHSRAARARPFLNTLKAWLDVARGPIEDDAVWPRLSNYPYGPAPR